jgi:hypothetical protein
VWTRRLGGPTGIVRGQGGRGRVASAVTGVVQTSLTSGYRGGRESGGRPGTAAGRLHSCQPVSPRRGRNQALSPAIVKSPLIHASREASCVTDSVAVPLRSLITA